MIIQSHNLQVEILGVFVPVPGIDFLKKDNVFRVSDDNGNPIIYKNMIVDDKYYSSISSFKALSDAAVDKAGQLYVEAVPEEFVLGTLKKREASLVPLTPKRIGLGIALTITDILILGLVSPALISAANTLAVVAGLVLMVGSVGATLSYMASLYQKENVE